MAIPFLNNISLNNNEIQNVKLHNTANIPSPSAGHIYFDTDDSIAKVHDGSAWIDIVPNTNDYVNSATFSGSTITLGRTGGLGDVTVDIGSLVNDSTITITAGTALTTGGSFTTNQAANGEITINHENVSRTDTTSTDAPAYGGTFEAVTGVTTNAQGHVTAIDVSTVTIPATDNTDINVNTTNLKARLADLTGDVTITGNTIIIPGDLQVTGTTTTNNVETVSTSNGVVFEGNTADDNEVTLLAQTVTADRTIVLPDANGTVALTSDIKDGTLTVEGSNGLTGSGTFTANDSTSPTITISHADTSSQASVNNSGRTYIQDITLDNYGHITAIASATETVTDTQLATAAALIDVSAMTISQRTASIAHGLDSQNLIVQMYDVTTGEVVFADIDHTNSSTIAVTFAQIPTNDIRVVVIDAKNSIADSDVTYS